MCKGGREQSSSERKSEEHKAGEQRLWQSVSVGVGETLDKGEKEHLPCHGRNSADKSKIERVI